MLGRDWCDWRVCADLGGSPRWKLTECNEALYPEDWSRKGHDGQDSVLRTQRTVKLMCGLTIQPQNPFYV